MDRRSDGVEHGAARIGQHDVLDAPEPRAAISFTFDDEPVAGFAGEPIAAALLAAGVRVFRTVPRFGDARGGYCMVGRCADCLVVVDGAPNVFSCMTPVAAGMTVRTQDSLGDARQPAPEATRP